MSGLEVVQAIEAIIITCLDGADFCARQFVRVLQLYDFYGPWGIPLLLFGNRTIWRIQAQTLGRVNDDDALAFKKSVYDECTMIAVASAIVAQIAITGLSLNFLSQTHWVARASFVLSLIFALMAVYYATTQQRTLGRLLTAKEVRSWIRGGNRQFGVTRIVPSFDDIIEKLSARLAAYFPSRIRRGRRADAEEVQVELRTFPTQRMRTPGLSTFASRVLLGVQSNFRFSEPDKYVQEPLNIDNFEKDIIGSCFTPSEASVITISAPQMLLSASLLMLLIALGIYLGFLWTRRLDQSAGINDSRSVSITYVVGLAVSGFVYSISQLFQDLENRSERQIVEGYLKEYVRDENNSNVVRRWGVDANVDGDGVLSFTPISSGNSTAETHETQAEQQPAD